MRRLTQSDVRSYLNRNGIVSADKVEEVISGFDFAKPVYEHLMDEGSVLHQFIRNPTYSGAAEVGNWFALPSATMAGLAIFGGGAGRHPHRFRVAYPFVALEGTAAQVSRNWTWAGGGPGGHTQVFVPKRLAGHLASLGPL